MVDRNIWIEPMGVDMDRFSQERRSVEMRERLLRDARGHRDSVLLLYAGRLAPEKNLSLLFELVARLAADAQRDFRLLIAGDGIERARWEAFCEKRAAGRVAFLGHIKNPVELANLFANADIFVHPNPREPFGIAPLEAMASGLPVLFAAGSGVAAKMADCSAVKVLPGDDLVAWSRAIAALAASPTTRLRDRRRAVP